MVRTCLVGQSSQMILGTTTTLPMPTAVKYLSSESVQAFPLNRRTFTAFRTMHDAWSSLDLSDLFRNDVGRRSAYQSGRNPRERAVARRRAGRGLPESVVQTMLTREIFGDFVPPADYPSSQDIQRNLDGAIQLAVNRLATGDRSLLSDAFSKVFSAISDETGTDQADGRTTETIRSAIGEQLEHLQDLQSEYGLAESDCSVRCSPISKWVSAGAPGQSHDDTTRRVHQRI